MAQRAVIVNEGAGTQSLNDLLHEGYKVVQMCPMVPAVAMTSGGESSACAQASQMHGCVLVIVEK